MKELIDYKEKNGNCNVPQRQSGLGIWVKWQRQCYKNGKLSQKCTNQLEDIGFSWGIVRKKINQLPWEVRFKELDAYKEKNGNCSVPRNQGKLGRWVANQRTLYSKKELSQECTAQLQGIGFVWDPQENQWEDRFSELVVYKEMKNNCNVLQSQGVLGKWVSKQRRLHKKGKLSPQRTAQLMGIGFIWNVRQQNKHQSTGSTDREDLTALNNLRGLLSASISNPGEVTSIALSEVNPCYTREPLEDNTVTMSLISIYDINVSERKVRNSLKLRYNGIIFDFKQMCKQYSEKCVVHFVGIGNIKKDGTIAGIFNHSFGLVDKEPEGTTVISHLRTSPSTLCGRSKGLATLVLQVHQCFCLVMRRKGQRIFLIAQKNDEELVGPKGFYTKRGFKEYEPTQNKSDRIISQYVEECQDGHYLLLLNDVFSTSHEANRFKEMKNVANIAISLSR